MHCVSGALVRPVLLSEGGVWGLAVLNLLCSGVMCLSWPGDFLLPEALKVITVEEEEDLSSAAAAAAPVWSSPQSSAWLTLPEVTSRVSNKQPAHTENQSGVLFHSEICTLDLVWGYSCAICMKCMNPHTPLTHSLHLLVIYVVIKCWV